MKESSALCIKLVQPPISNIFKNQQIEIIMKETILSIAGRPGLFRMVSQGRGMLIVESIDADKKRMPAGARDRVTALNEVAMYTDDEDIALMDVFESIRKKYNGAAVDISPKKATDKELADFLAGVLPNYDRDRVYMTDVKRLIQWYNILVNNGYTDFKEPETAEAE